MTCCTITEEGQGMRLTCVDNRVPADETNLVLKCARALLQEVGAVPSPGSLSIWKSNTCLWRRAWPEEALTAPPCWRG